MTQDEYFEHEAAQDAEAPWYHGVKWYWRDVQRMRTLAPGVLILGDGIGCGGPWGDEIDARNAEIIAAAPETATERDALKAQVAELTAQNERQRRVLEALTKERDNLETQYRKEHQRAERFAKSDDALRRELAALNPAKEG